MDWLFLKFGDAYLMQNSIQKFRQGSIVFEKPDILSEKLKNI